MQVKLRCIECEKPFTRAHQYIERGIRRNKVKGFCCSRQCSSKVGRRAQCDTILTGRVYPNWQRKRS